MDDPLSAVDSHVARHLFTYVLGPEGLLASKARILATNAISFIEGSDEIIMLRNGSIVERGTHDSIHEGDSEIARLLREFGRQQENEEEEEKDKKADDQAAKDEPSEENGKSNGHVDPEAIKESRKGMHMRKASFIPVAQQKAATLRALKRSTRSKEVRIKTLKIRDARRKCHEAQST